MLIRRSRSICEVEGYWQGKGHLWVTKCQLWKFWAIMSSSVCQIINYLKIWSNKVACSKRWRQSPLRSKPQTPPCGGVAKEGGKVRCVHQNSTTSVQVVETSLSKTTDMVVIEWADIAIMSLPYYPVEAFGMTTMLPVLSERYLLAQKERVFLGSAAHRLSVCLYR